VREMDNYKHTVLLVDDEENVLHSLKRLLRKEGYQLFTASSGAEGLKALEGNDVHLVISDQRMPQMSGTEFFAIVKERYPDAIRIILTGYTDVDSITESINKGHIYKFFLKPWNDQGLKLEIKSALEQYDLIQANTRLHEKVLEQNEELKKINENLEMLVKERTIELEIQNQALELSRAMLEDLALPIIGVSAEGLIAVINRETKSLSINGKNIEIGKEINDYFSPIVKEKITSTLKTGTTQMIKDYQVSGIACDIDVTPLSGKFCDKGVILCLKQVEN
jgi:response regulator RpfG family c-di-GMP phosphodiesterase